MKPNINTKEYWDKIYLEEGDSTRTWRTSPELFYIITDFTMKTVQHGENILELGCGVGVLLKTLKAKRPDLKLKGIDISSVAINHIKKLGVEGEVANIPPIPEDDNSWDNVFCFELFEHLDDEPRLELLKEVKRVLKDDGMAIISVPNSCLGPEELEEHRVKYTKESWEKFLRNVFKYVIITEISTHISHQMKYIRPTLIGSCVK